MEDLELEEGPSGTWSCLKEGLNTNVWLKDGSALNGDLSEINERMLVLVVPKDHYGNLYEYVPLSLIRRASQFVPERDYLGRPLE